MCVRVCVCVCVWSSHQPCRLLSGAIPAQVAMSNIAVYDHHFHDEHVSVSVCVCVCMCVCVRACVYSCCSSAGDVQKNRQTHQNQRGPTVTHERTSVLSGSEHEARALQELHTAQDELLSDQILSSEYVLQSIQKKMDFYLLAINGSNFEVF